MREQLIGPSEATNKLSLKEMVESFQAQYCEADEVVTQVKLNGKVYDFDQEDALFKRQFDEFSEVGIITKERLTLAYEALDSCNLYIDKICHDIGNVVRLYKNEKEVSQGHLEFSQVIEYIDLYIQLFSSIYSIMKEKNQITDPKMAETIQKYEIHLLSVLKSLIPAQEKGDLIMLCDLLEYELVDNLTRWKIQIIPQLKKQKTA